MNELRNHGTARCCWRGCRQDECRKAHARYTRERRESTLQDTEFVMAIVKRGPVGVIAKITGLHPNTLTLIRTGKTRKIYPSTERKILRLP